MSRSSDRGTVEALVALLGVVIVGLALSLYAGSLQAALFDRDGTGTDRATVESVERAVAPDGVAHPVRLARGAAAGPADRAVNVTLRADGTRWSAGPTPPADRRRSTRPIGVRTAPGLVRSGVLGVVAW